MPTGHVKVYHERRNYGFVITEDGNEVFLHGDQLDADSVSSGDELEFEIEEQEHGNRSAVGVSVVKSVPPGNPVGRTMTQPPTWDQLENLDRRRRSSRRRRR